MNQSTKTALAVVAVIALAGAFWLLLLGPKREKAGELSEQTTSLHLAVLAEQQRAAQALAAKERFPAYYRQLVVLGEAVPSEAATPSLLVQLNGIGRRSKTSFQSISLGGGGETSEEATEGVEATMPIGASAGPAGLSAMPYSLRFEGGFFYLADFVHGIDAMVKTKDGAVDAHGRLITIDGFNLAPAEEVEDGKAPSSSALTGTFKVSTYVTPPGQGLTAGATSAGPETATSP